MKTFEEENQILRKQLDTQMKKLQDLNENNAIYEDTLVILES